MNPPDVIIVGGGPSGVICATTIAKQGYSVVIIDRKSHDRIGDKTCGDAVDKAALQRVYDGIATEFPNGDEVTDIITKMSVAVHEIDNKITLDAPGFLVDRLIYGQRLLKEAEEAGVRVIDSANVKQLIIEEIDGEKYVSGVKYLKKGEHSLSAKFVIDASGAYAVVRKSLPDELVKHGMKKELSEDEQWPSYREIIELKEDHRFANEIILKYDNDFPPPGYFWIFSKGKQRLNVGIGWAKSQKELGPMRNAYLKEMEKYYPRDSYTVLKQGGGQIPFRVPFDNLVFNGGALVGDAACMVHPVTAEGHGPALDTAWRLGNVIVKALKADNRSMHQLWEYNVEISRHYGRKHTESEILRRMIEDIGTDGLNFLFNAHIFKEEELNLIFSGDEIVLSKLDIVKRIIRLMRKPRLLLKIKKIMGMIDQSKDIFANYPKTSDGIEDWRTLRNNKLNMNY